MLKLVLIANSLQGEFLFFSLVLLKSSVLHCASYLDLDNSYWSKFSLSLALPIILIVGAYR